MTGVSVRTGEQQPVYDMRASVLVVAADAQAAHAAQEAVRSSGARVVGPIGIAQALGMLPIADLLLLELEGAPAEDALALLTRAAWEAEGGARLIASFAPEQIDMVAATLLPTRAQLLCAPRAEERVAALAFQLAERARGVWLHDVAHESEGERLRRVQDEVARIAEALTRLTREPGRDGTLVRAKGQEYRGPEGAGQGTGPGSAAEATGAEVRQAIRARRMRAQFFDELLFADPAWDMLLDLYAAHQEGLRVSVSSLCIAAAVPPTTALRWITTMHDAGLFERQADPDDRRRAYIRLSQAALEAMRRFTGALRRAGLQIP